MGSDPLQYYFSENDVFSKIFAKGAAPLLFGSFLTHCCYLRKVITIRYRLRIATSIIRKSSNLH